MPPYADLDAADTDTADDLHARPPSRRTVAERNALAMANRGLVGFVLKRLGIEKHHLADDLYHDGFLGLLRAAEKYDPAVGPFSTYACLWIKQVVLRSMEHYDLIRVPNYVRGDERKQLRERLTANALPGQGRDSDGDLLDDRRGDDDQEARQQDTATAVEAALATLPPRLAGLLRRLYLEGLTLQQVAKAMGVSKQRIAQLKLKALAMLRQRCPQLQDLVGE